MGVDDRGPFVNTRVARHGRPPGIAGVGRDSQDVPKRIVWPPLLYPLSQKPTPERGGREGRKRSSMGRLARRWPPDTAWLPVARGVHEALVRPPLGIEGV